MRNLEHPVDGVRYRTRIELSGRPRAEVLRACQDWMKAFRPAQGRACARTCWRPCGSISVCMSPTRALLDQVLASPEPHARIAAATVRHHWYEVDHTQGGLREERKAPEPALPSYGPTRALSGEQRRIYDQGREIFHREAHCATCHQADGKGLGALYPPLAGSDWLDGDDERLVKLALKGLWGPIEVSGRKFDPATGGMPPMIGFATLLKDEELAAVLSYVKQSFGNNGDFVSPDLVKRVREATKERSNFYMADELLKEHPLRAKPAP
jgi:mono/diheme cytochrome c family protein